MKSKEQIKIELTYLSGKLQLKMYQHKSLLLNSLKRLSTSQDKVFQSKDISTKLRELSLEIDKVARQMISNEQIKITYLSENLLLKVKEYKKLQPELVEQLSTSQDRIDQGQELFTELRKINFEIDNFLVWIEALSWVIQD